MFNDEVSRLAQSCFRDRLLELTIVAAHSDHSDEFRTEFEIGQQVLRPRQRACADVSFDVPPGRVCAVLGANGAGKSTMIRILLGLENPDAGSSQVLGMDSRTHGLEIRRRVGYMPEKPTLYDWMTVEEIGWFAAGFYVTGFQAVYDQYIRHFQVDPKQKIKNLSKGTRARSCCRCRSHISRNC